VARFCTVCLVVTVLGTTMLACIPGGESRSQGEDILATRCGACHSLSRVRSAHKTRDGWLSTVERMRDYGAQLGDDEATILVDYLADKYK